MMWWIVGSAVAFVGLIWVLSVKDGPFEFMDLFLDQQNNRASLAKLIIIWLLALSTWVVIVKVMGLYEAPGIETLLVGLVTVFVGQVTVLAAIDRWKSGPPPFDFSQHGRGGYYRPPRPRMRDYDGDDDERVGRDNSERPSPFAERDQ